MNTHFCPGGKICCNVFVFPPQVPLKGVIVPGPWVILRAPGEMHCTERTSLRLDESGKKYIKNMYKVYAVTQFNDLWISQTGLRGCVTDDGVTVWGQSNKILSLFKPCVSFPHQWPAEQKCQKCWFPLIKYWIYLLYGHLKLSLYDFMFFWVHNI